MISEVTHIDATEDELRKAADVVEKYNLAAGSLVSNQPVRPSTLRSLADRVASGHVTGRG
ncbi:hypothetical protein SEA_KABOCHA_100 [Gordonia phage Kabocha]|uniref:Uncharacterized protein n=1 Tax=Gordonia phage Chidiebere TaxID=2656530 RepID=A0A649VKU4_9CAUD|nr:hypothetical protein PQD14_gp099 [Gordonia phage Chidiebere]AZS07950.1 hypothetical protein PBI_GRAY_99 [Gordonia phage Gray]WAA19886.1 hypothetical protein SEA_KABOCHA_100 [Gordonia phage Kabocha]WAA20075.1 hypothetical protein SEA_HANEM_98 [Gordonia phage Hanem]WNM67118.1 hypothetical protein SEA_SCHOMBER_97 [Gordonia Phage Schomber]QGJ92987.1 hypothetical protein PBI_CHIDIEBERE_99 [Gordonia phage Chidiebere]